MRWWSAPENETMSEIGKTRLDCRIVKSLKNGVNDQAREFWAYQLDFLLGVASCAVSCITGLNESLCASVLFLSL